MASASSRPSTGPSGLKRLGPDHEERGGIETVGRKTGEGSSLAAHGLDVGCVVLGYDKRHHSTPARTGENPAMA
jgi:hypothetical protein